VLQIAFVVLPGTLNEGNADRAAFAVPIVLGVLSGMYIVALKLLVIMIRRSTFRLKWQPKIPRVHGAADTASGESLFQRGSRNSPHQPPVVRPSPADPDIMAASNEVSKRSCT